MVGYVEARTGNKSSLEELFQIQYENIVDLLQEMKICKQDFIDVQQLINECLVAEDDSDEEEHQNFDSVFVSDKLDEDDLPQHNFEMLMTICGENEESDEKPKIKVDKMEKSPNAISSKIAGQKKKITINNMDIESDDSVGEADEDYDPAKLDSDSDREKYKSKKPRRVRRGKIRSEVELKCKQCRFKTLFTDTYEYHMYCHVKRDSNKTFKCDFKDCGIVLNTRLELKKHKHEEHAKFICDICGACLKHKYNLEIHLKRHTGVGEYQCSYCAASYYTQSELKIHMSGSHLNQEDYKCSECGLSFKNRRSLTRHKKFHSNVRNFVCDMCSMTFKTSTHLNRHQNNVHRAIKFNCELCDISYGRKDKLRMHMEVAHGIQTYFNCEICLKTFPTGSKLEEHKYLHDHPRDMECGICLTVCLSKEDFDNHLCITYRENYVCCDRDFRYHLHYNKHMFLVHGVKVNARVKPVANVLTGCARAARVWNKHKYYVLILYFKKYFQKYIPRCPKCEKAFPSRRLKDEHVQICGTEATFTPAMQSPENSIIPKF